jgi:ATPase subunit of ABC transporter with duplicated ATPase domains
MSYLDVKHVSYSFGGRQILDDVTFQLEKGEHIGLVGANGEANRRFLISLRITLSRMMARSRGPARSRSATWTR